MKTIVILFCLFLPLCGFSQTFEILEKFDTIQKPRYQEFRFLNDKVDITNAIPVAKIKAVGSLEKPLVLHGLILAQAQKLGANAYRFESFKRNDEETGELILMAYFATDEVLEANFASVEKNVIYIIGDQNLTKTKSQSFKINGKSTEISAGHYRKYPVNIGEEIKINKGGFTGMTLWISGEENKSATFLNFSGIGVAGMTYAPAGSAGGGIAITTGKISKTDPDLAQLLLKLFEEQK